MDILFSQSLSTLTGLSFLGRGGGRGVVTNNLKKCLPWAPMGDSKLSQVLQGGLFSSPRGVQAPPSMHCAYARFSWQMRTAVASSGRAHFARSSATLAISVHFFTRDFDEPGLKANVPVGVMVESGSGQYTGVADHYVSTYGYAENARLKSVSRAITEPTTAITGNLTGRGF